jgi:NAD(P)-dependent dehydrogenase (short-subunit alcohol dehydrogenase family)
MDLGLAGNAALTTASSSGLGKASATALAREGANVVVNGRDEDRLAEAVEEIEAVADGRVLGVRGDLTDPDDIERLVERTAQAFGTVDHVVTSAGGPPRYRFPEAADRDWYEAYDLLVMSVVRLLREAEPHLQADGGSVVHITSISIKEANHTNVLSSSVRAGVEGIRKTLSEEFAPDVRVNSVLPGLFLTARREDPGDPGVDTRDIPLGRMGDAREMGEVVAFLCSERASYLTGAAIPVDGGTTESTL